MVLTKIEIGKIEIGLLLLSIWVCNRHSEGSVKRETKDRHSYRKTLETGIKRSDTRRMGHLLTATPPENAMWYQVLLFMTIRTIDVSNTWLPTTGSIPICRPTFVNVKMTPERFAHKAAEHWSARVAGSIFSAPNLITISVYKPNRSRHRAVRSWVFGLWVTKGERTVVLAIFALSVAEMEYLWGCGMDMPPGMHQLVRGDGNDTRKATSLLRELERRPN